MEGLEPKTDREIMLMIGGKIDTLSSSIDKFAEALEKLEEIKIVNMEARLDKAEKFINEWGGIGKFILIAVSVLAIFNFMINFFKK